MPEEEEEQQQQQQRSSLPISTAQHMPALEEKAKHEKQDEVVAASRFSQQVRWH
jgi:hypothetical protein